MNRIFYFLIKLKRFPCYSLRKNFLKYSKLLPDIKRLLLRIRNEWQLVNSCVRERVEFKVFVKVAKVFTKSVVLIDQQNFSLFLSLKYFQKSVPSCKISYHLKTFAMQIKWLVSIWHVFLLTHTTWHMFLQTIILNKIAFTIVKSKLQFNILQSFFVFKSGLQ